jgi:hypothetical protein
MASVGNALTVSSVVFRPLSRSRAEAAAMPSKARVSASR